MRHIVAVLVLCSGACVSDDLQTVMTASEDTVALSFTVPVGLSGVAEMMGSVDPVVVQDVTFVVDGVTVGMSPSVLGFQVGHDDEALMAAWAQSLQGMAEQLDAFGAAEELDDLGRAFEGLAAGDLVADTVTVARPAAEELLATGLVRVADWSHLVYGEQAEGAAPLAERAGLARASNEGWAPYGGGSDVSRTRASNTFLFSSVPTDTRWTYEHETQIYSRTFATYNGTWSSTLPSAYRDTPFLDQIFVPTVGTSRFSTIRSSYRYSTYLSLRSNGADSTAVVRIKGQRGHRTPSGCYSTWCIYADQTTGSMAYFTAPAGLSWVY